MSASNDQIDPAILGERLAWVRRTYGRSIDLSDLTRIEFAAMLGVCAAVYEAYELGERMPTADFLVALRERTGISLGWLFGSNQQCPMPNRSAQSLRSVSAYPSNLSISSPTDAVSAEADRSTPAKVAKFALG